MQTNESGEGDDRRARSINEANDTRWLTIVTIVARIIKPLGKVTVSWPAVFVSPISSVARKILEKKKDGAAGCSRVAAVPVARTASTLGQPVILELSVLSRPAGRERDRERERERDSARPSLDHRRANISREMRLSYRFKGSFAARERSRSQAIKMDRSCSLP